MISYPADATIALGVSIVRKAGERGVTLRLCGSVAVSVRCEEQGEERLRQAARDVDFAGYRRDAGKLEALFEELGYRMEGGVNVATEGRRWLLVNGRNEPTVDVFFDELDFCHRIDLRGRLGIDPLTITLADLLLSKLQYVKPRQQDLDEIIALLSSHEISSGDGDLISSARLGEVICRSWGFYYTCVLNLERIRGRLAASEFAGSTREKVLRQTEMLRAQLAEWPKGMLWGLRAKIGPRLKWYQDVDKPEVF